MKKANKRLLIIGSFIGGIVLSGFVFLGPETSNMGEGGDSLSSNNLVNSMEWKLLKEDSFEYEKVFENILSVGEWWKRDSYMGKQMEWFLEGPTKYAWTTTDKAHSGSRSAYLRNEPGERACLVAADFDLSDTWNVSKKAMSFYFFLPENQFETRDAGVWINIDLVDHQKEVWKNAIAGVNRFGDIYYGDGYGRTQGTRPYNHFNGGFTLDYDKWYKIELYADFDKFGSADGMILRLYTEEKTYEWALPLNSWSDQDWEESRRHGIPFFEFSAGAYYFAISQTKYVKEAYFDNVECYIALEGHDD